MTADLEYRPTWKVRRVVIGIVLLFCAGCIVYVMIAGTDSQVHQAIAMWSFITLISVIGTYVFGSVFESHSIVNAISGKP